VNACFIMRLQVSMSMGLLSFSVAGKDIEKAAQGIYPLQNTFVRKVKVLRAPKFDLGKLMEVHGDYSEDIGAKVERPAEEATETPVEE
jgi:small subunit ribosomal protein S3Ae